MSDAPASSLPPAGNFAAIILAAGASTRLGQPKQLLRFRDQPLIVLAARAALDAGASPVVIVLGAHSEKIRPALAGLPVLIAENTAWPEGMGASIHVGIDTLNTFLASPRERPPTPASPPASPQSPASASAAAQPPDRSRPVSAPHPERLLIALCDQPHLSSAAIEKLRAAVQGKNTLAATRHPDGPGAPAVFHRVHFPELRALPANAGARRLFAAHPTVTAILDLPELTTDIDTPADWLRLT